MLIRKISGNGEHWKPHGNASTKYTNVSILNQMALWVWVQKLLYMIKWRGGTYHMEGFSNGFYPI